MKNERFNELLAKGNALLDLGKLKEAELTFVEAAKISPEGWFAVGMALMKQGENESAAKRFAEVLQITKQPKVKCAALNNLGMIHANLGRNAEALECFTKAKRFWSDCPDTHSNVGLIHLWNGDYESALRENAKALRIDPWHEAAQFIRAMALLQSGDYERGWDEYECRWRSRSNNLRKVESNYPEWDGTNGQRVFIYGEQGHGDSLLMLRYAKLIRERGVWQSWVAQKSMAPLLRTIPEIDHVCEVGDPLPDFDCHLPAVSLPRLFKTTLETIPPSPYIKLPGIVCTSGKNVGICWKGSAIQKNDYFRSTSLESWKPVLSVDGLNFFSLQVDNADEAKLFPQLVQFPKPENWLVSARKVSMMDLVISVDTSIVHLCGAMGVPCWCALHCRPYFVYPKKFPQATPWYQSVKLFRQAKELEWSPVFETIAKELETWKHAHS